MIPTVITDIATIANVCDLIDLQPPSSVVAGTVVASVVVARVVGCVLSYSVSADTTRGHIVSIHASITG